jgi:uncharacterized repeat protein (TIGR01451 family)
MGRRLLLILGMMLLATSTATVARGQSGKNEGSSGNQAESQPAEVVSPTTPGVPLPFSDDIIPARRPDGHDPDEKTPAKVSSTPKKGKPSDPPAQLNPKLNDPSKIGDDPKEDLNVRLTQAAPSALPSDGSSSAPPSGATSNEPESARPELDRLPLGKQSVAVTVDVQAPASMNLNREATLKLIVRNTGNADALNVMVHDELPEGLDFQSSVPDALVAGKSLLNWRINTLPAGAERTILVKVKPTKTGPFDNAATVTFMTGSKSRTRVLEPKLKVDVVVNPSAGKVLKGQPVEFKVSVTNTGDGPARNVSIKATLSKGLRHETEEREYELTLPDLAQGQTEKLDPLMAAALVKGEQSCTVVAKSPDVEFKKDEAESTKSITVVAPELKLTLTAPESRYTDTVADYEINLENTGTAPARKVRVLTTLPVSGRLVNIPKDADYDRATRRLQWKLDQVEPNAKPSFSFQVRMTGSGFYECFTEATADGTTKVVARERTEVMGMPVVELDVTESKRVLDVNGTTTFQIRISNSGTKDAMNPEITAILSPNLKVEAAGDGTNKVEPKLSDDGSNKVWFRNIDKLPRDKEIQLGIKVRVLKAEPRLATCRVTVKYEDLPDGIDDMAAVKVIPPGRTASAKTKTAN